MLPSIVHSREGSLKIRNNVTQNIDTIARLTEAQRECLRLVMAGYKSKEIAHKLGIGVDAVNKRLAGAKTALNAPSRFVAARQLAAWEAGQPSHSLVSQTLAVEPEPIVADASSHPANEDERYDSPSDEYRVREEQAPYLASAISQHSVPLARYTAGQFIATPAGTFLICLVAGVLLALLTRL